MNGEMVCHSRSLTVLSCTKKLTPVQDDKTTTRLSQDGRCSPIRDGRMLNANEGSESDQSSSPRLPDDWPSHPPLQTCLLSAPELKPPPLGSSFAHAPLHDNYNNNNNNRPQRRGARAKVTAKKPNRRTAAVKNCQNRKVTDYYPIRRSSRKSKTELKCEQKKLLDELITGGIEEGMEVQQMEGKGRAVFATRCFQKGDFVVEYHGDLLQITDAKKREAEYAQNPNTGCYMYYFQYLCKTYCVDATSESGRLGRLINHSKNGNLQTKLHDINGVPHLILVASRDIDKGEELLYDYGDRSKASIAAHPWLKD